ncbi:helix-turn-helix transcriptional regulator [Pseudonocardia acaciae]|uniref:helix-turn-helix transcriptional regulator n=1 Tax=Pseudonocardia acaciae TaxID=551276 RepID=UPI002480BC2E|nr:AraC family transcriptional regulator [Pseudonocardia acaciae]
MAGSPILSIERAGSQRHRRLDSHSHPEPMLLWASTATVTMRTAARDWLVPPGHGLWVPAGAEHSETTLRDGEVCVVRITAADCPIAWPEPTGVSVGPLLRELLLHLSRCRRDDPSRHHAESLLFGLLTPLPAHTIQLAMPSDPRVRGVAESLVANPADPRELAVWAGEVHSAVRTLSRLFVSETGLTFAQWRTHLRIRAAAEHLAAGASVGATARAIGYRKPSAFIAAFRRTTGQTPSTYLRHNPPS